MAELFRPQYSPEGWKYRDAKQAGVLKTSPTWWVRYWNRDTRQMVRESTGTNDHRKAKLFLAGRKTALAKGEPVTKESSKTTFNDLVAHVREDFKRNGKNVRTLESRLAHLIPVFGQRRIANLIPTDLESYITARRQNGAANGTINRELEVIARAINKGRDLYIVTSTLRVRRHRLAEASPRAGFFERDAFDRVMENLTHTKNGKVREPAHDLRLACTIAYVYGWRLASEVLTLQRRHVSLDGAGGAGTLSLDPGSTKNKDGRSVVLTPALRALIVQQLSRLDEFKQRTGMNPPWLFIHFDGRKRGTRVRDMWRSWGTACKAAGVSGMIRHDFRRTAVRNMVNAGIPERVAMQVSGHRTRTIFDRYHIVSQRDHVHASELLAKAWDAK